MTRKRHLTSRIKPATKHALMAQLAMAASEIESLRETVAMWQAWEEMTKANFQRQLAVYQTRRWWHRLMWWRA